MRGNEKRVITTLHPLPNYTVQFIQALARPVKHLGLFKGGDMSGLHLSGFIWDREKDRCDFYHSFFNV